MALPEENFGKLVMSVERHPLFHKYLYTSDPTRQIFSYGRHPRSGLAPRFMELKEEIAPASSGADIQGLLEEKRHVIALCQKIGERNFERYFLYGEGGKSVEEIAKECGVTPEEARQALALVTQIGVQSEFYEPPGPEAAVRATRIAHIERAPDGGFSVRYTSLKYARGRYVIHYDRLQQLRGGARLSPEESRQLKKLIVAMEFVNARRSTVSRLLDAIVDCQGAFLRSGRREDLQDLTQENLAVKLGIHSSTVSRIVSSKSVLTPWNEERRIKDFLGRRSVEGVLSKIADILEEEPELLREGRRRTHLSDEEIRQILSERGGPAIALRTVAKYRSILKIPNVYSRARAFARTPPKQ